MIKFLTFAFLISLVTSGLGPTKNCQVNDPAIQKKAKSLKKGTQRDTAREIFKFVQWKITYVSYSNTKQGAVGTLKKGSGNCCDQAHLIVALWRAAGINARYAHGSHHWWGQAKIDGKGCDCDPTNKKHEFCKPHHGSENKNPQYFESLDH